MNNVKHIFQNGIGYIYVILSFSIFVLTNGILGILLFMSDDGSGLGQVVGTVLAGSAIMATLIGLALLNRMSQDGMVSRFIAIPFTAGFNIWSSIQALHSSAVIQLAGNESPLDTYSFLMPLLVMIFGLISIIIYSLEIVAINSYHSTNGGNHA